MTNGVRATTPPASPVIQSRTTSPLTSSMPEALKSSASVLSRAEKLLYSEVVSGQVSRVSSPPTGRCPGGCPSENPAEAAVPAEALAKTPEVNASTCEKDLQTHSLDMCASGEGHPADDANRYNIYCATENMTSASDNDSGTWITVERKKSRCDRKNKMPAARTDVLGRFGTKMNNDMPPEAGASKGKGPDPKNWGNVRLTREEMDPDSQRVLLDSYKSAQKNKKGHSNRKKRHSAVKHEHSDEILYSTDLNRENDNGRAMRSIEQVEPNSYIGLALNRLKGGNEPTKNEGNNSFRNERSSESLDSDEYESSDETESSDGSTVTDFSSDSLSTDSDESSSSSSNTLSSSCKRKGRKCHGKGAKSSRKKDQTKRKSKKKHSKKMTLKPIPPTEYNGVVDPQKFHRFIMEGIAYVRDGHVPAKKCVFILSHYLTGRAHEFYTREVAGDPYQWRLPKFFKELFNYCFPIDFRTKQR